MSLYVVITVDAENHFFYPSWDAYGGNPLEYDVAGESWGMKRIAAVTEKYACPLTVFLSVFEVRRWGVPSVQETLKVLGCGNHDIQLHTHPDWYLDMRRESMWEYSLQEQIEIIAYAKKLFEEMTGKTPIVHRAGAYGLNDMTLEALRCNGIRMDMSMFYGHPNCRSVRSQNSVVNRDDVLTVPVSVVREESRKHLGPLFWSSQSKYSKMDVNWQPTEVFQEWINQARGIGLKVLVVFMHSYSLLNVSPDRKVLGPNPAMLERLNQVLHFLTHAPETQIVTAADLLRIWRESPGELEGPDGAPLIANEESWLKSRFDRAEGAFRWRYAQLARMLSGPSETNGD